MAINLSDNIQVNAPKPSDSRYLNNLSPYSSVSAANTALVGVRYTGLTVNILGTEYWYCNGIADENLVVKLSGGQLNWTGSTANGIGTYVDGTLICAQSNLTFDGTKLNVLGDIQASTCVVSPLISGQTISGSTAIHGLKIYENGICLGSTYKTIDEFNTYTGITQAIFTDSQDPTGFINNQNIVVTYDGVNRTINLSATTGTVEYYWKGTKYSLGTSWTSTAHDDTTAAWYLYSTDGADILWSNQVWNFTNLMVASRPANTNWAIREVHGTIQYGVHEELHKNFGTYRDSGFGFTSGTYAIQPAIPSDTGNTIGFEAGVIRDEDISTSLSAWIKGEYTHLYFTGASSFNITTGHTDFFVVGTTYPLINNYNGTTFGETEMMSGRYANWYVVRVPVTNDSVSQKYRAIVLQPQFIYTTLAAAQSENPQNLYLGDISDIFNEFVLVERMTLRSDSTYSGATGKVRIEALSVLSGTRYGQVSTTVGLGSVTAGNVSVSPQSPFTATNMQSLSDSYAERFASAVSGATNLGTGNGTLYTSVDSHNIQLKSLSAGTNITLTCNDNYVTINSTGGGGTASGERVTKLVNQPSHGFDVKDVLGWSGGTYNKAIADGSYDGEILGIVSKCYNADCFDLTQAGYVTGLTSLSVNSTYFLSPTTAGLLTATRPTITGEIVKSVLIADSETSAWVLPYAGFQISVSSGGTSAQVSEFTITGNSTSTGFTVIHGKNKQFVMVEVIKNTSPYPTIYTNVERTNADCVCITFDTAPANGQEYKILIIN